MSYNYTEPSFQSDAFNCPHCDVYAHQEWYNRMRPTEMSDGGGILRQGNFEVISVSFCSRCGLYSIWINKKMVYPTAPLPIEDMPEDVKEDFIEARNIVNLSPRGSSALLRLALQKLMPHIGESGLNLNQDIKNLVDKGLSDKIQKALDSLRVIGNESVHPGELDLKDDIKTATALFKLLNLIVEVTIVRPKEIEELYETLPQSKKEGILNRDNNE